jgi:hypothetical protein
MAYRQYTSCVKPDEYVDAGFTYFGVVGGITTLVTFIYFAVTAGVVVGLEYAAVVALIDLISLLYWWLNGRLICLGGERCVIGVNMGPPTVQPEKKGGDDDASINVVLAPSPVNTSTEKSLEDIDTGESPRFLDTLMRRAVHTPFLKFYAPAHRADQDFARIGPTRRCGNARGNVTERSVCHPR